MTPGLEIEYLRQALAFGGIEVALHIAVGDPRTGGQPLGNRHRLLRKPVVGIYAVDDAQPQRRFRIYPVGQEVEFAGLGRADKLAEEIAAAEVAGISDI